MKPLFSVIIPNYNHGKYLIECLQSVQNQSFQDWDCVIVDDGSTDNSIAILKEWCATHTKFSYIQDSNHGLPHARNVAAKATNGSYIIQLDADDYLDVDYMQQASQTIKQIDEVDILVCANYTPNQPVNIDEAQLPLELDENVETLTHCAIPLSVVRRILWQEVGGYDDHMSKGAEDWEFWIRVFYRKDRKPKIIVNPKMIYRYRKMENGNSLHVIAGREEFKKCNLTYIWEKHKALYYAHGPNFLEKVVQLNEMQQTLGSSRLYKICKKISNLILDLRFGKNNKDVRRLP